jgi:hypothetical protein
MSGFCQGSVRKLIASTGFPLNFTIVYRLNMVRPYQTSIGIERELRFLEVFKFCSRPVPHVDCELEKIDGKRLDHIEYQVVVLTNEEREVKLGALQGDDGKAQSIAIKISGLLDEFDLWGSIEMIICDTTNVNSGVKGGVVTILQRMFSDRNRSEPQYIGCQHHILDKILRLVMDEKLIGTTSSPNIEYPFIPHLIKNYEALKSNFRNGTQEIPETCGWRDDMRFLFHLTRVYRFFRTKGFFPKIQFKSLPQERKPPEIEALVRFQ